MRYRCAILDDYHDVATGFADWSAVEDRAALTVFHTGFADEEAVVAALAGFHIVCVMRERTPLPARVLERLPDLRLIVTTGMHNAAIDMEAAGAQGITVCGTEGLAAPTVELTFALILEVMRGAGAESARMKAGQPWQTVMGRGLEGKTLGVLGLGRLGGRVAEVAQAFGMKVVAWSPNLTDTRCREVGARRVSKEDLLATADIVTIHLKLGDRSRGLIDAAALGMMKPGAVLINTSRGPIVDEAALIDALSTGRLAGAGLDVYDREPLPADHPFRQLPTVVVSPHLGYVTAENFRIFYRQTAEAVAAWLDGAPVRRIVQGI
ncbi:D-2-hydroxyacid dehydrogenase family protein [Tistrella mobilis]|uniref:D-2-hydroxyacid dehydrogenase family protein n=1 Tax=Tistrella mobilis TaxID=171437 RepID=UPI003558611A